MLSWRALNLEEMVREMVKRGLFLASEDLGTAKPVLRWEKIL